MPEDLDLPAGAKFTVRVDETGDFVFTHVKKPSKLIEKVTWVLMGIVFISGVVLISLLQVEYLMKFALHFVFGLFCGLIFDWIRDRFNWDNDVYI